MGNIFKCASQETSAKGAQLATVSAQQTLTYQLLGYREHIGRKKQHFMKWMAAKILLTNELIKTQTYKHKSISHNSVYMELNNYQSAPEGNCWYAHNATKLSMADELMQLENYRDKLSAMLLKVTAQQTQKRLNNTLKRKHKTRKKRNILWQCSKINRILLSNA